MEFDTKIERIMSAVRDMPKTDERSLIAVGGPPASGKSTLAEELQKRLVRDGVPCALVPMDGFHLDNAILEDRDLLNRKGAPETFDLQQFVNLLTRLKDTPSISIPLFDRTKDCVVDNASEVTLDQRIVVVEGNYLFLELPGWQDLKTLWSLSVFLSPSLPVLEERLIQRWVDQGMSQASAEHRAHGNDMVNAKLVLKASDLSSVDLVLS